MKVKVIALFVFLIISASSLSAQEPMIGEVKMFAGAFAPRGWAFCDGQLLSVSSNTALFSILGTTYGGDGRSTFALPDLRDRTPIHVSNRGYPSKGLITLGQKGGSRTKYLKRISTEEKDGAEIIKVLTDNGSSSDTSNVQSPYLGINYIICLDGTFPSRN